MPSKSMASLLRTRTFYSEPIVPTSTLLSSAKTPRHMYRQVKSSQKPSGPDTVIVDGSTWSEDQLRNGGPIFNKHDGFRASLIVIVTTTKTGETEFYIAPPAELEKLLIPRARTFADLPKRDGKQRSIAFRKELPREVLKPWLNAWQQLGEP